MADQQNGGGYGNPGASAQSPQQAQAQSQPSPVLDEAVEGKGVGLHNQTEAFRSQTQIAYDAEEE